MLTERERKEIEEHLSPYFDDPEECGELHELCKGCEKKFSPEHCKGCIKLEMYLELKYLRWCKSWQHGDDMSW